MLEKERAFKLLVGLSTDLDKVCGRVFGKEPLPSAKEMFSSAKIEENGKNVMMG